MYGQRSSTDSLWADQFMRLMPEWNYVSYHVFTWSNKRAKYELSIQFCSLKKMLFPIATPCTEYMDCCARILSQLLKKYSVFVCHLSNRNRTPKRISLNKYLFSFECSSPNNIHFVHHANDLHFRVKVHFSWLFSFSSELPCGLC